MKQLAITAILLLLVFATVGCANNVILIQKPQLGNNTFTWESECDLPTCGIYTETPGSSPP